MRPTVSVVTPAFNAEHTLRRAHASVRTQSYDQWEHVIVDDGSTDGTSEVIAELAADRRVKSVRTKNGGTGWALNLGIEAARGEYIAFLDADDEYLRNHVSARVEAMERQPNVDVLWGGFEVIADSPEAALVPDVEKGSGFIPVFDCVVQGTIFVRRRVFDTCRFTTDRAIWFQDYEFVQRARLEYSVSRFETKTYRYYRDSGTSQVDRAKVAWAGADS